MKRCVAAKVTYFTVENTDEQYFAGFAAPWEGQIRCILCVVAKGLDGLELYLKAFLMRIMRGS